jgi:hypothetical protein
LDLKRRRSNSNDAAANLGGKGRTYGEQKGQQLLLPGGGGLFRGIDGKRPVIPSAMPNEHRYSPERE